MSNTNDFVINNGVLKKYLESDTEVIIPYGVKSIGNGAFHGCTSLTSITIPDGVTSIRNDAFFNCSGLTSVTIPASVKSIGECAFSGCTSLTDVTISNGVTSIGGMAFCSCSSLTSITIPDSIKRIEDSAFVFCQNLTRITLTGKLDLLQLAELYFDEYLGTCICRQANEETMSELIKQAAKWEKKKKDVFFTAYLHSDTKTAMLLAEKRKELAEYAALRGMTEDELRDSMLSDPGLDENRCKRYDLGNQTVTVRMGSDFTFSVETPNGKSGKSLPKKGADPKKFEAANTDFAEIKKNVKKIWKNRADLLLKDFVSGKERTPEYWKKTYGSNPILHGVACLIVWEQGGETFTRTDAGPIRSDGSAYELTDNPIRVAHPMEMDRREIENWQAYFSSHGLKQPFAQIWEPVRTSEEIAPDRYKGCPILFFALQGADKHGFNEKLEIPGCEVTAEWSSKPASNGKTTSWCDIQSFKIKEYSRAVNHAVAYLDRVTVLGRIEKDDLSAMNYVTGCNIAQMQDYIAAAQKGNAVNVLAALLEYKNANFPDFDPMAEFMLEW